MDDLIEDIKQFSTISDINIVRKDTVYLMLKFATITYAAKMQDIPADKLDINYVLYFFDDPKEKEVIESVLKEKMEIFKDKLTLAEFIDRCTYAYGNLKELAELYQVITIPGFSGNAFIYCDLADYRKNMHHTEMLTVRDILSNTIYLKVNTTAFLLRYAYLSNYIDKLDESGEGLFDAILQYTSTYKILPSSMLHYTKNAIYYQLIFTNMVIQCKERKEILTVDWILSHFSSDEEKEAVIEALIKESKTVTKEFTFENLEWFTNVMSFDFESNIKLAARINNQ